MLRFYCTLLFVSLLLLNCGTPVDPESIDGDDGGYKIVSRFTTTGYAQDVVIDKNLAFVAQGEGGLMIINISDPKSPTAISIVNEGMKGYANKVSRKDSVLYIASGGFGVSVVNAADPEVIGNYTIELSVSDTVGAGRPDVLTGTDTLWIAVREDACEAKKEHWTWEWDQSAFDVDLNCIVELSDLQALAAEWLDDQNLTEVYVYPR